MFFFFLYAKSLSVGFLFPFYGYGGPHNSPEFIVGLGREGRTGGEDYCLLRWCCVWLFPFFLFCFPHLSLRFAAFFFFFFALLFPSFLPSSPPSPSQGRGGGGGERGLGGCVQGREKKLVVFETTLLLGAFSFRFFFWNVLWSNRHSWGKSLDIGVSMCGVMLAFDRSKG